MLTLISPAKTLDYDSPAPFDNYSVSPFLKDSRDLMKSLQQKNPQELSSLMGLSKNLSELNFERNMNWSAARAPSETSKQAIYAFRGDVYQGLDSHTLNKKDVSFAQSHLIILSGLYGVLRPLDLISPYRLEMGTKLKTSRGANLYEFWGSKISQEISSMLESQQSETIINLASVEYFTSVKQLENKFDVISPIFKDYKSGKYKIISFYAKKARGLMERYIIQNRIDSTKPLERFNLCRLFNVLILLFLNLRLLLR